MWGLDIYAWASRSIPSLEEKLKRLKLATHLAEAKKAKRKKTRGHLILLDEPTTGLHVADIEVLP